MALRTGLIYVTSTGSHYLSSEIALIFLLSCSFIVVYDACSLVGQTPLIAAKKATTASTSDGVI